MSDLREWLAKADALGQVKTVPGIPWDLDIGVITEIVGRQLEKPAIIFDDIPGYPSGHRVLVNPWGSADRFALTTGLPLGLTRMEIVQEWRRRSKEMKDLPPRFVDSGPVMENALFGEEVDLLQFPVPKWHERDGGRYMGTGDVIITQGPEGDWVNLGTYRAMLHDRNHVGLAIERGHHGRFHMDEWFAQGKPAPMAIAIGMDPLLFMVSASEFPWGYSEYDYAGAIRGEPIEVMKGPITGLPIPASAEIVLEGYVDPQERRPEGPFGEYIGYYGAGVRPLPTLKVEGLYFRNNPIILGSPPLRPPDAQWVYRQILKVALIWDALEAAGVPDVTGVWCQVVGNFFIVVSVKQRYPGHAKQAARIASSCLVTLQAGRFTVVVDEDIDVTDLDEVLWAMCTRVDPDKDIEFMRGCLSNPLDPMIPAEKKEFPIISRVLIDATRPYEWRDRFPAVVASSPELKAQVLGRWGEALKGIL